MLFQPITVTVPLYDEVERGAFGKLMIAIDEYRQQRLLGREQAHQAKTEEVAQQNAAATEEVVEAKYEDEPKVVATITAEGAVKPVKEAELTAATQAYLKKHGVEPTLALVREFGVQKVTEVTDPVKRALLFQKLTEGVK